MDPSKRDTLIQWINAINPSETIESLLDLRDGEQLISLLRTITGKTYDKGLTRKERFEFIQKFIEDYYSCDFNGQVNFDRDNELDLAKMLVLVLSAGVQGECQEMFMNPALSLDQRSQVEIMNILKEIVSDSPNKLNLDNLLVCRSEDTFDSLAVSCLFSPEKPRTEDKSCPASAPSKGELQNRSTSTSSLNEIMSPFQRINVGYSPVATTPLHSLITSTGFSGRIIQRERNLRKKAENEMSEKENFIKKLTSQLNMERHLRSDIEMDMQEKIKTINTKDDKIRELMTQNRTLKQLQDKLDELNTLKEEYEQMSAEAEKSRSYAEELKDLRLQNSSLKKEMNDLYEEINNLKEMKTQFKILKLDCNKYVEELQKEEKKCVSLQSNLDLKQKALEDSINSKNFTEDNLAKMKEMYEEMKRQYEEILTFQSVNEPAGERMTVITDQLMDELRKELDDLKNTWIAPNTHEELKIKLANIVTERDTFESKSLKLSEEVLQMHTDNDMLKKKNEDFEIELEKCQRHLQDGQRNIEKMTSNLENYDAKETQWHQSEMKYKTDLHQLQSKMDQMQMELSCVSTELKLANAQLESDFKSSEMRRQTLVVSVGELRNEKKKLEQTYEADKAAVQDKVKGLRTQLDTLKMEFASREQELLAESESISMERKDLEQQLKTERRHRETMEKNLTSQREEIESELNETICHLRKDLKANEEEILRLRSQLREQIDEYDGQVESLTNVKFELQAKVNKLESQASLDKQERLKLQTEVKLSGERAEELNLNIGKITEKLNKAAAEKKENQEKLADIEKKLEIANEESRHWMNKNGADKKTFETKILALEQERTEFIESNKYTQEKLNEELKSSLDENCNVKSQLQKQTDLLTDTRAELEEKSQHLVTVQEQHSQLQKLHSDLQEQNSVLNNTLVMSQSQLACKESEVTDLERKLDEVSTEKTILVETHEKELCSTRQALSQEVVNLNEQIESSKSTLISFVEQVAKLTNTEFSTDDINVCLNMKNLVESVGKGISHSVEDHSKMLVIAQEKCTSQETQLLQLEENLQVKLQEAECLKKDLGESKTLCEQLQTLKDQQGQQIEEYGSHVKILEEQKSTLESQIVSEREALQNRLDTASVEYNTTVQLLEEKTACIAEMQEQSIALGSVLKSVREDMCQLEAAHNELQQVKEESDKELSEKKLELEAAVQKTSELTLALTEKDSLIESQSETQRHLEESVELVNQKLSSNVMEINLLKSDLEQKDILVKEKNNELAELSEAVELKQRQMTELTEEHMTAIASLQQEVMLDYEQKLDAVVADYENKICENYVSKAIVESLEAKQKSDIEELRGNLQQEHTKVVLELQEEHKASVEALNDEYETQLLNDYVPVRDAQDQNRKHFLEVEQLQNNVKEYQTKLESQENEYKNEVQRVVLEFKEKIAKEFIPNSVFDEHKEKHLAEITQIQNEMAVEYEQKVQQIVEQHESSLKQLTCSYEEKLTMDYVPRQTVEEEKENLVAEMKKSLEGELQEKNAAFQIEHEALVAQTEQRHQEVLAENYVEKSALAEVAAKLAEKEKELSQQRAESDLIVATSEKVKEQHEASVKAYEFRVSELEEKLGQQENHINCLEEQVVNEKFDGERQASEMKRVLEGQLTEMKKQLDDTQRDLTSANESLKVENDQLTAQVGQLESHNQEEMTRITENYQKDFEQMKQDYQSKIVEIETTYKTEIDQLKECHLQEISASHTKYEEIHQNLLSAESKADEAISSKEQKMKDILSDAERLKTEKTLLAEKLSELESEITQIKEDHELTLKTKDEDIACLNSCINKLQDERRTSQGKCDKAERQLREREQKLILENMKTLSKAEEMNKSLNNQLMVAQKGVSIAQKKMELSQKEVDSLHSDLKVVKQMKQKAVNELQEYKIHFLELKENFSNDKSKLEKNIRELEEKYTEVSGNNEHLNKLVKHYQTREESKWSKLIEQSELDRKTLEKLSNKVSALEHEKKSLAEHLKEEEERFKANEKENRSLNRKVNDLTEQLEKAGNALFDTNNHDFDLPNDSLDSPDLKELPKRNYDLRSKSGIWNKMKVDEYNVSPMSFQSRSSTSSYKSITSNASTSSKTPLPPGCGKFFSCEDEPATFDWGRITEIRRRNTMVPAHLRSTYPAELQNIPNALNDDITKPSGPGSGKRKRKSPAPVSRTQVKERPGTPGKSRRLRVRTTVNNENSPQSDKKRLRTTANSLKVADYTGRPSMAFEISNTPKLAKRRQKGRSTIFSGDLKRSPSLLIQSLLLCGSKSVTKSQMPESKREPLKTRNCTQTHL